MYTVLDVVELGEAHELILSLFKEWFMFDDFFPHTLWVDDPWD